MMLLASDLPYNLSDGLGGLQVLGGWIIAIIVVALWLLACYLLIITFDVLSSFICWLNLQMYYRKELKRDRCNRKA